MALGHIVCYPSSEVTSLHSSICALNGERIVLQDSSSHSSKELQFGNSRDTAGCEPPTWRYCEIFIFGLFLINSEEKMSVRIANILVN